jgi:hypothetical protein
MKKSEDCKEAVLPIHLPLLNVWGILKSVQNRNPHLLFGNLLWNQEHFYTDKFSFISEYDKSCALIW